MTKFALRRQRLDFSQGLLATEQDMLVEPTPKDDSDRLATIVSPGSGLLDDAISRILLEDDEEELGISVL